MLDSRSTSAEIAAQRPSMAVLGVASIENHGVHLPLATDWYETRAVCERVAAELNALLLPVFPFSMSQCHGPAAGTIWLRPETLAAVVRDIVLALRGQGIRQVVVVNGHGGNFVLAPVVRDLNYSYPDLMVLLPPEIGSNLSGLIDHADVDNHAGEYETAMMLEIAPQLVGDERIDYVPDVGRGFFDYAFMLRWAPSGAAGIPSAGTAEKGRQIIKTAVSDIVRSVREALGLVESTKRTERGG